MSETVLLEPAVLGLVSHLSQAAPANAADVRNRIAVAVDRGWGTSACRTFKDRTGPGWMVDVSKQFDDEMLYAIVRSMGGTRQIVAVVDVDTVEAFHAGTGQLPSVESTYGVEETSYEDMSSAAEPGQPLPVVAGRQARPAEGDAALIIYVSENGTEESIRTTNGEIRSHIEKLLETGVRPDGIEIWTGMRTPKVQITF